MTAILDIDFVAKLTRLDLLRPLGDYLRKGRLQPYFQPSMVATFDLEKRMGSLKMLDSEAERAALAAFITKASKLELDDCGKQLIEHCHLVEGIDSGDALWLAAGACMKDALIFTHDKRALRAVASATSCKSIAERLAGRVVCLEQFMLQLIEQEGVVIVRKQVRSKPNVDPGLAAAFPTDRTPAADAQVTLNKAISELRYDTGKLLRN